MMHVIVVASLMFTAAGQLATKDVVDTPVLDMVQSIMGSLQDSDSVEQLEEKVGKVKAAKASHEEKFKQIIAKDGAVNSKSKLAQALRQTAGTSDMLNSCMGNDSCMDTLFARMDRNNDGKVEAAEYKDYMVNDGTNSAELKGKRQAAAKVLRTLRTADVNGDNVISPQEFAQWREELDLVEDSALSYETFDIDQDGEVTKSEFAKAILKLVETRQNKLHDNMNSVRNVLEAGKDLMEAAKKHQNLQESFRSATDMNFKQKLEEVPEMNLEGAMQILQDANNQVLRINEAEKTADQFTIKIEGKSYKLEGNSKKFYRDAGRLNAQGFNAQKVVRALVAAQGNEPMALRILCQSEEAEDTEACDEAQIGKEDQKGTSFVEGDKPEKPLNEQEQEEVDLLEERERLRSGPHLADGTPVDTEILLPAPSKELPRFRQKRQQVMQDVVNRMTEAERKALLSSKGKKNLRQIMPKHADSFAKGMLEKDETETPDVGNDQSNAIDHVASIAKTAAQPAIDVADLGLQMMLGPKNEFVQNLPQKIDDAFVEFNKWSSSR